MRLLAGLLLIVLGIAQANAASCLEEVRELARTHRLSTDPGGARSDELARSRGVIEPPATPDRSVITPPLAVDPGMKTVPEIAPDRTEKDAVDRTTLQSILSAARAQAERGEESRCREQLAKAHRLIERARP
jgi:hypothetical protein